MRLHIRWLEVASRFGRNVNTSESRAEIGRNVEPAIESEEGTKEVENSIIEMCDCDCVFVLL